VCSCSVALGVSHVDKPSFVNVRLFGQLVHRAPSCFKRYGMKRLTIPFQAEVVNKAATMAIRQGVPLKIMVMKDEDALAFMACAVHTTQRKTR
jgi:hypothetical protein